MFNANDEYRTIFLNFCMEWSLDAETIGFEIPADLTPEWRAALRPLVEKVAVV